MERSSKMISSSRMLVFCIALFSQMILTDDVTQKRSHLFSRRYKRIILNPEEKVGKQLLVLCCYLNNSERKTH